MPSATRVFDADHVPKINAPTQGNCAMDERLDRLIEAARTRPTDEQSREEQRVNFAYGNASEGDKKSTKESVRAASTIAKAS